MAKREKENQDPDLVNFKPSKRGRFVSPLSKSEMDVVTKGFIPENTKTVPPGLCEFSMSGNRASVVEEECPEKLLEVGEPKTMIVWLCRFVTELRKQNGSAYPPKTIHLIMSGLQWFVLETRPNFPRFFDQANSTFRDLRRTCDSQCIID